MFVRKLLPIYARFPNGLYYGSYILIKRPVLDAFLNETDRYYYNVKLLDRLPGKVSFVHYDQDRRYSGESSYDLFRLIKLLCRTVGPRYWERLMWGCLLMSILPLAGSDICQSFHTAVSDQISNSSIYLVVLSLIMILFAVFYWWAFRQAQVAKKEFVVEIEEDTESNSEVVLA